MSTLLRDYGVILYWLVYLLLLMLPKWLYHAEHVFERKDVFEGFPRFRRILDLWPRITSGLTVVLLLVIFGMWFSPTYTRSTTVHAIGIAYGAMLVLDAGMAWVSGIRPLSGLRQRYVVPTAGAWRAMVQFTLSLLYLAVPVVFLMNR
jgi:hypothetical protein